ncbi:hypothetical protein ABVT39_013119 [Epinephelus coioides]
MAPSIESSQLGVDQVLPFAERLYEQLSEVQLQKLRDGNPDEATKDMLAELLIDLMVYLKDSLTNVDGNQMVTEESVAATLGNVVPEAFAQALGVNDQEPCVSSETLTKMMSEEIAKSISSSSCTKWDILRLAHMIEHACSMITSFMGKVRLCCRTTRADLKADDDDSFDLTYAPIESSRLSWHSPVQMLEGSEDRPTPLVTRVYKKAKVNIYLKDPHIIINCLFEKIWAEVQGADYDITPETFKSLDKTIFKDLCRFWGCAELVLVSLCQEQPEMDYAVCTFTRHLKTPQRSTICRFFSSLGRVISNSFRRVSPI